MEFVKDALNWFEIPVADFERAKKFYETIFNFEMPVMDIQGIQMGMFLYNQDEGGVGGAICYGEWHKPSGDSGPKVYLNGGNDLGVVLSRVEAAGGTITMPKTHIASDIGYMAFFADTEGNVLGLHSPN